jgi:hypothetical protein
MIGSSGAALPSPACSTSGSPVKIALITAGSEMKTIVPTGKRTVIMSP